MNAKMLHRMAKLNKLAKKDKEKKSALGPGKYGRKEIEKRLQKAKKVYTEARKKLKENEDEMNRLEELMGGAKGDVQEARDTILRSHDVLQTMDFSGASSVRFRKAQGDVSYAIDGKWHHLDQNHVSTPYSEWKKSQNNAQDGDTDLADDSNDDIDKTIAAVNSGLDKIFG